MQTLDIKSFQDNLGAAKSVLILLPEKPEFDHVAGALALSLALQGNGKETTVASASPVTVEFNRLIGVNKITDTIDNHNLTISFEDYDAQGVERVSYNIEEGKFMLVISPKPGIVAPNKDQVIVGYKGITADIVLVVGVENKSELGKFAANEDLFGANSKVVLVNNIPTSGFSGATELINPNASSNSEVSYQLIEALGLNLNPDIATNLFMGLRAGSDNFQRKVTAETFAIASKLLSVGASIEPIPQARAESHVVPNQTPKEWMENPKVYKGTTLP